MNQHPLDSQKENVPSQVGQMKISVMTITCFTATITSNFLSNAVRFQAHYWDEAAVRNHLRRRADKTLISHDSYLISVCLCDTKYQNVTFPDHSSATERVNPSDWNDPINLSSSATHRTHFTSSASTVTSSV